MIVLKFLFKFINLMNSETSSNSLAVALALGAALGLVPFLTLQGFVLLAFVLFFRVNLTATLASFLAFWLVHVALAGPFDSLGASLLAGGGLRGLWTFVDNNPVLYLAGLTHSITLASTLAAVVLLPVAFLGFRFLIKRYREFVLEWVARSRLVTFIKGFKAYRLYRLMLKPLG